MPPESCNKPSGGFFVGRKHGTIGENEREEGAMKQEKAYYHLPGLFEFYELYREFLPLYR